MIEEGRLAITMWARQSLAKFALLVALTSAWNLDYVSGHLALGSESDYGNGNVVDTKSHTTHFNKGKNEFSFSFSFPI